MRTTCKIKSTVQVRRMHSDLWWGGTFLLYSCKATFRKVLDVERSFVLRSAFAFGNSLIVNNLLLFFSGMGYSFTRPGMSLHVTQFKKGAIDLFPTFVLQATNAGVRRPGYEAMQEVRRSRVGGSEWVQNDVEKCCMNLVTACFTARINLRSFIKCS